MSAERPLAVVKYGSSSVADSSGMDFEKLGIYAGHLAELRNSHDLVVVTSGAIAVGRSIAGKQAEGMSPQVLATIGSGRNFTDWQVALEEKGIVTGQLLVTHNEIDSTLEGGMLKQVMLDSMADGVVSLVNENDALSDTEIAALKYGGDNDGLARHIAQLVGAKRLCLMTNMPGLVDRLGGVIDVVTPDQDGTAKDLAWLGDGPTGRGGMQSKVLQAITARNSGIDAYIGAAGAGPLSLIDRQSGTYFPAQAQ